jgi:hypothetical protein
MVLDCDAEAVQNVDADANDMEAFWTSLEAFHASWSESSAPSSIAIAMDTASAITATTVGSAEGEAGGEAELAKLLWGKSWLSAAEVESEACLVDLLAQADHDGALNLKAEDILQQDIFA